MMVGGVPRTTKAIHSQRDEIGESLLWTERTVKGLQHSSKGRRYASEIYACPRRAGTRECVRSGSRSKFDHKKDIDSPLIIV